MRALHAAFRDERDARDGSRWVAARNDSARVSSEYQLDTPVTAARHRAAARRATASDRPHTSVIDACRRPP